MLDYSSDQRRVTVAIPTCGRPEKLRMTVERFLEMDAPLRIDIWDSAPNDANRTLAGEYDSVRLFESDHITGPAEFAAASRREM